MASRSVVSRFASELAALLAERDALKQLFETDAPKLAEREALAAAVERVRQVHYTSWKRPENDPYGVAFKVCGACHVPVPCDTIVAVDGLEIDGGDDD